MPDMRLLALARTIISQGAFEFVRDIGYSNMKNYISRGAEDVLEKQLETWLRNPDIWDTFRTHYINTYEVYCDGITKKEAVSCMIHEQYDFIRKTIGTKECWIYLFAPKFLKTLMLRIEYDDVGFSYEHSLLSNCQNYFDEISECMRYAEDDLEES